MSTGIVVVIVVAVIVIAALLKPAAGRSCTAAGFSSASARNMTGWQANW